MKRIDHILFRADTDFIAFSEAQIQFSTERAIEPCSCFAWFIKNQINQNKDISDAMRHIESVMEEGGWNAEQLTLWFFPALNIILRKDSERNCVIAHLGPKSKRTWIVNEIKEPIRII